MLKRALATGDGELLRGAIAALEASGGGDRADASRLANLGVALRTADRWGLDPDGLERGIAALRRAVELTAVGDPARAGRMTNLGVLLRDKYDRAPVPGLLDEAIELIGAALADPRATGPDRAERAGNLAIALLNRHEREHRPQDLAEAVRLGRLAVAPGNGRTPESLAASWNNLAGVLEAAFAENGDPGRLTEAVGAARRAVALLPEGRPMRGHYLVTAGQLLALRHENTGEPEERDDALRLLQTAVRGQPSQASWRPAAHTALASVLFRRAYTGPDGGSLTAAIEHFRLALDATGPTAEAYPARATNLANALGEHFVRSGSRDSLDTALRLHVAAADAPVNDLAMRSAVLSGYGETLLFAFQDSGDPADLARAERLAREAVTVAGRNRPRRSTAALILARVLRTRSLSRGDADALDESIRLLREALAESPAAGARRIPVLLELGSALRLRYDRLGEADDLDVAITAARQLLGLLSADDLRRDDVLARLSLALRRRAARERTPEAADAAVDTCRAALDATPPGDTTSRRILESNLGAALRERAEITGALSDLDDAAAILVEVADRTEPDSAIRLCDAGTVLRQQAARRGEAALLDRAIGYHRRALGAAAPGSPELALTLHNLAGSLRDRHVRTGSADDLTEALALLRRAAVVAAAPAPQRLGSARTCASLAADTGRWAVAAEAYATAIRLLRTTVWHGIERSTQLAQLDQAGWLAADAAACALRAGDARAAVRVLEDGRSLLWQQRVEADASLRAADSDELRDRLLAARAVLDRDPGFDGDDDSVAPRELAGLVHGDLAEGIRRHRREERLAAARAWDEATRPIFRRRRGPARPPRSGTVVLVVVSRYGCSALLRSRRGVSAVPLTRLDLSELAGMAERYLLALAPDADPVPAQDTLTEVLGWLWRTVVAPVLAALGHDDSCRHGVPGNRVWWCATGPLSLFPLHAAGEDEPGRGTLDHVVSSYTPTLAALRGRPQPTAAVRVLAVGTTELAHAEAELDEVAAGLAGVDRLVGADATPAGVLDGLTGHQLVHLVCHGEQDFEQPSRAGLRLAGGRLTVDDLARRRLAAPIELAYLAACQTAWPGARLSNEALHLAAALYFTGCRHVIATLWPISDRLGPLAARHVYRRLRSSGEVRVDDSAAAVHSLTRTLRDRFRHHPALWAAFVHYGR